MPETQFVANDGLMITYQVAGDGPSALVLVPGFISHVELNWEYPFYSSLLERLSQLTRLVVLDKRGTGLSDRSLGLGTLEERMSDVRAVMDNIGIEHAVLMGTSEDGAMCAFTATTSPSLAWRASSGIAAHTRSRSRS